MKKENNKVKVSYERDADVLRFEAPEGGIIDHAQEMGNLVVHFTKDEKPVLVEVLETINSFRHNTRSLQEMLNLTSAARIPV